MESSGPEGGKVRGPAAMIHERYLHLARDASSSGDRVLSENFLQHADHYFRLWRSTQPATPPQQQMTERYDDGAEGEEDSGEAGEDGEMAAEAGDQPDVEFPQGQQQQQFDRDGGPRRRGRRNRYRPNEGEGGGEPREGGEREGGGEPRETRGEQREGQPRENRGEPREDRPPRRERPPREREENAGPEGFSSGPKPAFLRGGD
jgi:hypothetical protein